ncbi:MAG: methylamine utilization protein MauJ, partial [Candidatus Acidiferrales bacterium]
RKSEDADRLLIFSAHTTPTGVEKIEVQGIPNKEGRLAQCCVELNAPSFAEADRIAFGAVSSFFSTLAFEIDVPVRLGQLNIEQTTTQNASMTYTCPYPDVHLTAAGTDLSNIPYIQSLLSLYREGINSNSMNYQYLCWYKIIEGINWKRTEELSAQSGAAKAGFKLKFPEALPCTKEEMRKVVAEVFPLLDPAQVKDERWDHVVPDEGLGWRFNRIRQERLEEIRNKIAHMLSEPGGDLSLSPDTHSHRAEVTRWISLLRLMARVMIRNEKARLPQPPGVFDSPPQAGHISQLREEFRKS